MSRLLQSTLSRSELSACSSDAFDIEDKVIGTIGAGQIGLQRLVSFNPKELLYYHLINLFDLPYLPGRLCSAAKAVNARRVEDGTRGFVNSDLLEHFKQGRWLVNTARSAICDKTAVADAIASGRLREYAGDVWECSYLAHDEEREWGWEWFRTTLQPL
jgi:formate dehydrogenase